MQVLFERLKCSGTQAKLYLLLLELGPSIASMLSKRARIKRVTVYGALEGLLQKGLIETFRKNNVSYYQASDPEVIGNVLDMQFVQEQEFNQLAHKKIEELKQVKKKGEKHIIELKGVIRYYEGRQAVETLIRENLTTPDKLQYCIGMSGYYALQDAGAWKEYIQSRVKNGMKVLSIQADTSANRSYKSRDHQELRETQLIPSNLCPDHAELNIIGDRIVLFTDERKEALGIKIINKTLADVLKKLFELAWDHSCEFQKKMKKKSSS
jgi:sugar-specific transcriptional regulator TrmB